MEEIKSVKVDNWGVFFLQKLQNFFNKTDYCDLTLQFNDNSQLKVHRLVLSACTDYFNVLEQTCELIEDVLIMPPELQADVVVPIVNFMYTGTLEFELKMYGKLLKTARDMNMTVLSKLLEAHRRTMEGTRQQTQTRTSPKTFRRGGSVNMTPTSRLNVGPGRPRVATPVSVAPQRGRPPQNAIQYKSVQIRPISSNYSKSVSVSTPTQIIMSKSQGVKQIQLKGPSRYEESLPEEGFESTFESLSYESKPLMCKEEPDSYEYDNVLRRQEPHTSSPFEQLRRGYTNSNNKRPASSISSYESPPEKKPNIQDVKEYAEQQRMRKQIAQEFDEDNEYEETLDDEFQNDDDDDEYVPPASIRRQVKKENPQIQQKKSPSAGQSYKKQDDSQRPTIVVKDSTSSNVNHAKIISEVLRKYPHLVKNNKNIKLKIMQQSGGSQSSQKIIVKEEPESEPFQHAPVKTYSGSTSKQEAVSIIKKSPPATASASASTSQSQSQQPRRIDSKTMHALIAMGAENRNGPWLCLRCGVNGRPISIPSYRGFRRHLINVHKEKIDPRLCEHCGWRSANNKELYHHMLVEHSIKPPQNYAFPSCSHCHVILLDNNALQKHMNEAHTETKKGNQECIYCNETFAASMELYNHMKSQHRERAREDGVLDFSDDEMDFEESDGEVQSQSENGQNKIQILSDISLPKNSILRTNAKSGEKVELNSLGTGIAASLGLLEGSEIEGHSLSPTDDKSSGEPKFVNVDGSEMELTPAQRQEIIKQLGQEHDGLVMVLNDDDIAGESRAGSALKDQTDESMQSADSANEDEETDESSLPAEKPKKIVESKVKSVKSKPTDVDSKKKTVRKSMDEEEEEEEDEEEDEEEGEEDSDKKKSDKTKRKTKSKSSSPIDSMEIKKKILTDWEIDESDKDSHKDEEIAKKIEKNKKESKKSSKYESDKDEGEMLFESITTADEDSQNDDHKGEEKDKDESTEDEVEKELKKLENAEKEEPSETDDKDESKDNISKAETESTIKDEEEDEQEQVVVEAKEKETDEDTEDLVDTSSKEEKLELDDELKLELEENEPEIKDEPEQDTSKENISDSEHSDEKTKNKDDVKKTKETGDDDDDDDDGGDGDADADAEIDDDKNEETDKKGKKDKKKDEDLKKSDPEDNEKADKKSKPEGNGEAADKNKKKPEEDVLLTKADIKNLIDDWGEDDDL